MESMRKTASVRLYGRLLHMKGVKVMYEQSNRLRNWIEQDNIVLPSLFFKYYKELRITDDEAIIILQLLAFQSEKVDFPTPTDLSRRMHFTEDEIATKLRTIIQKGFLEIRQGIDDNGKLFEKYSLFPLWERILDLLQKKSMNQELVQKKKEEGEIFALFEQEFGRLLSPMEIETISMWLDHDGHSPKVIKEALKEAVLAGKLSFRYIDRILFEWKKKNIKTIQQIEKQREQFSKPTTQIVPTKQASKDHQKRVPFYNWLDERE